MEFHTFPRLHMEGGRSSHDAVGVSYQVLKLRGTLTSLPRTVQASGDDLVVLFLGGVLADFGHKFSFLFFSGEILEVGYFSGESIL